MIVTGGAALPFAPQALAEVVPISSATGYFYADQGIELLNRFTLYGEMYRCQPWLHAVADKVSNAAARLSFNSWDTTKRPANSGQPAKTGKVLDTTSAFAQLWRRPCPFMPRYSFWRWTFGTYEVYGEAFWLKIRRNQQYVNGVLRGSGPVLGLYPMHPSRTIVQRDKDTGRLLYRFTLGVASAGILTADEDEVVPFLRYNPDNTMRGLSRIEPLRSTLYNEDASRRAIESWWKRGARPSLMISAPQGLSDTAYERLSKVVGKVHGGADQMGGTLVLEEGAKPIPVQLSAEEMQYIQSRQLNREEVCGVYDVPPPVVHILDHATFSNITEQMRSMYRDTMAPRLEDVESVIEHHVTIPDFDPDGTTEGRFALDEVLRGDFETRAKAVTELTSNGIMKPSEARPLFDLDDAGPVADRLYANSAIQELGSPAEQIRIVAGDNANPIPATPAEEEDVHDAENSAARSDRQADEQNQPSQRSARRRRQRRGQWRQVDVEDDEEQE